ncbi:MAG: DnaJ domain-containing protein [Bacteriovoracaceae bacterium]|nr:DnaJ domain-containing protein [Bacteriovoracaceae bacterium]
MIRAKEAMLRRGNPSATGKAVGPSKSDGRRFKNKTEELYTLEFESLSKSGASKERKESAKKMIELISSGQWGEGPLFKEINTICSQKIGRHLELSFISKHINSFMNREIPLVLETKDLPLYEEVRDAIITKIVIQVLIDEAKLGDGAFLKKIASRLKVSPSAVIHSIDFLVTTSAKGGKKDLVKKIIESKVPKISQLSSVDLEKGSNMLTVGADGQRFINPPTLNKLLEDQANMFESLTRIPPLKNKKDLRGALKIFGMSKNPEKDDVKKRYKKLAQAKHPDRLASKGLPKEMEKIASENFAVIQEAYHIILDHIDRK